MCLYAVMFAVSGRRGGGAGVVFLVLFEHDFLSHDDSICVDVLCVFRVPRMD